MSYHFVALQRGHQAHIRRDAEPTALCGYLPGKLAKELSESGDGWISLPGGNGHRLICNICRKRRIRLLQNEDLPQPHDNQNESG